MKKIIGALLMLAMTWSVWVGFAKNGDNAEILRIALTRSDNTRGNSGYIFSFEKADVDKALMQFQAKLPKPLPNGAQIGFDFASGLFAMMQKLPEKKSILLTLDNNMNYDLTDDQPIEMPQSAENDSGVLVQVTRHYNTPQPHDAILPYFLRYTEQRNRSGQMDEMIMISAHYYFTGELKLIDNDYIIRLYDGDLDAHFNREKSFNVFVTVAAKNDPNKNMGSYKLSDLLLITGAKYEIKDIAEDGSWIEFVKSSLPTAAINKAAPDLQLTDTTGTEFHINDYHGRMLLLDFWVSYCKPCIAKFPNIKKMLQKYEQQPFAVIGINVDAAERVAAAKKVIADYQLNWRQVVPGKGGFIPVYQIYGQLPESPMSYPIYIAIDKGGIVRYASNSYQNMERFFDDSFSTNPAKHPVLFIPLTHRTSIQAQPQAIDFSEAAVQVLLHEHQVKLPANLPNKAKIGFLHNGTIIIVNPGKTTDTITIIADSNHDYDLTNDESSEIPIVAEAKPDKTRINKIKIKSIYTNGAWAFSSYHFFAKQPLQNHGTQPAIYYINDMKTYGGELLLGDKQYSLEIFDLNCDNMIVPDDTTNPEVLKVKVKKGDTWVILHQGFDRIPLNGSYYRIRHISDSGDLLELEKQD